MITFAIGVVVGSVVAIGCGAAIAFWIWEQIHTP